MAKTPPKKPKDPAKPTRAKAHRPDAPAHDPALDDLLNPGIARGRAGMGSGTGLQPPPDNSFDRRRDAAEQHTARKSTPEGFKERPQSGYVARAPFEGGAPISGLDPVLAKELGLEVDEDAALPGSRVGARNKKVEGEIELGRGVTGAAASNDALEKLLREGREEFQGGIAWSPHRPERPEKLEGGIRFEIKSDLAAERRSAGRDQGSGRRRQPQ